MKDEARYSFALPKQCPSCGADHTELVGTAFLDSRGRIQVGARCWDCGHGWWLAKPADVVRLPKNKLYEWRQKVLAQDGRRCHICGAPEGMGVKLYAHHIIPKMHDPRGDHVFDAKNGIAVCWKCHMKIHGEWMTKYYDREERHG